MHAGMHAHIAPMRRRSDKAGADGGPDGCTAAAGVAIILVGIGQLYALAFLGIGMRLPALPAHACD